MAPQMMMREWKGKFGMITLKRLKPSGIEAA
jgi:hypothetical protein